MKNLPQKPGSASLPDEDRLIPIKEVTKLLSVSARTVYRLIAAGTFPRPRKLGRKTLFLLSEVRAIMKAGAVS